MALTIPAEGSYTDIERDFIDNEPPGLFPGDQQSYWGQVRKVFTDQLQAIADMMTQWYSNMSAATVDINDIPEYEVQYGLPVADPTAIPLVNRRATVATRLIKGAFTRTGRRNIVESYIIATFGDSLSLTGDGLPLDAGGLSLHDEATSLVGLYTIVEDIPNFTYHVRIKNTLSPDIAGLTRDLNWYTPAGISFDIALVAVP